jgi:CHAD domain-containing protein
VAYRIKNGEAVPHAVARMARAELTDAAESISGRATATDRVHDMRTSLKKTRALLRLVKPSVGKPARRENRRLRDVARAVAGFRDADVVLDTFDALAKDVPPSRRRHLERPRRRLAAQLRAQRQQLFGDGKDDELRRRLRQRAKRVQRWVPRSGSWRAIGPGLIDEYRRAREAMANAYDSGDNLAFHEWRRAVKAHRHHVQALAPLSPGTMNRRLGALDRLGDLLGDEHDLTILGDALERERLLRVLDRRQAALRAQARPLGARLFAERPSDFGRRVHTELRAFRRPDGR